MNKIKEITDIFESDEDVHKFKDLVICLPQCGHRFHFSCIMNWISKKIKEDSQPCCPTCREPFTIRIDIASIKPEGSELVTNPQMQS